MTWIEPLNLEMWIMNVFAGNRNFFTAIALLAITMMAGYFRMTIATTLFLVIVFVAMFVGYVDPSIWYLLIVIGCFFVGFWIKKIVTN